MKNSREIESSWGCKEGGFEYIGMEGERAKLCWLQVAWSWSELLVAVMVLNKRMVAYEEVKVCFAATAFE